jgi:hypothetical protein
MAVADRRRGYRQSVRSSATLTPANVQFPSYVVHVFDLSVTGVGFSSDHPFTIDSRYDFVMRDGRQAAGKRIEIRSCRPRPDGMFDVGGQFIAA